MAGRINWRLVDDLINILREDIGRTDDELLTMLGCDRKELGMTIGFLYKRGRVDRCWKWLVLGKEELK